MHRNGLLNGMLIKKNVILALGGDPVKDKVAGFLYIGEKDRDPKETSKASA